MAEIILWITSGAFVGGAITMIFSRRRYDAWAKSVNMALEGERENVRAERLRADRLHETYQEQIRGMRAELTRIQSEHAERLENIITYGRTSKPQAKVLVEGRGDDEDVATVKLRERESDALTRYLMEKGVADAEKAKAEAERMLRHMSGNF